jgi:hypothetical protein
MARRAVEYVNTRPPFCSEPKPDNPDCPQSFRSIKHASDDRPHEIKLLPNVAPPPQGEM